MGCASSKPTVVETKTKVEEDDPIKEEENDKVPPLKREKKKSKRISLYGRAKRLRRKGVSAESEQKRKERKVGSIVFEEDDAPLQTYEKDESVIKTMEAALKNHFLFANMTDVLLRELVMCFEREEFLSGDVILEQGAESTKEDKMYLVHEGTVEIFIDAKKNEIEMPQTYTLSVDAKDEPEDDPEEKKKKVKRSKFKSQLLVINSAQGKTKVAEKGPGEIFGDIALLFAGPRSASVHAQSEDLVLFSLNRRAFTKLVVKNSGGTESIRFLREIPLLHTLSDNTLGELSNRMIIEKHNHRDVVIEAGGVGDSLLIIESGHVVVRKDLPDGSQIEVMRYGRGEFIGERSLMTGQIRTADCVAEGDVQILKLMKEDFLVMKPLIHDIMKEHMIFTGLKDMPLTTDLTEDQIEVIVPLFEEDHYMEGDEVLLTGDKSDKVYIVESGEIEGVSSSGEMTKKLAFDYFSENSILDTTTSDITYTVKSDNAVCFCLHREDFEDKLGRLETVIRNNSLMAKLRKSPALAVLSESELESLQTDFQREVYEDGEVIVKQGEKGEKFYILLEGEVVVTKEDKKAKTITEVVRLSEGDQFGERALLFSETRAANVIASKEPTIVLALSRDAFEAKLGSLKEIMEAEVKAQEAKSKEVAVRFCDLELAKVLGSGQFGSVCVCKQKYTGHLYALKKIPKNMVISLGQFDHVENERDVMTKCQSPFLVRLYRAFHDYENLFMVLELVPGGELFHLLDLEGRFTESAVKFFAASVILGFRAMHSQGIVYRDLKPENLLLDAEGYLKICDFGFAKHVGSGKTFTFCGTPDYQAPEIIKRVGHSYAADYWALGVLIYELMIGDAPFTPEDDDPRGTYKNILQGNFKIPTWISNQAADIIAKLLTQAPEKRLGCGRNGIKEIMQHPWFRGFDWAKLERRKMTPPIKPQMADEFDLSNFEEVEDDSEYTRLAVKEDSEMLQRCLQDEKLWEKWDSIDAET
ncbi:cGMP-dependent protein kinase [Chloropicon primus]|uniref:cGMP-dependent protein kinase n=1 Tax=Chloropicon primus TaxID=1764295 RepID=A0A5B8MJQ0_9CHLO|nr:cGMP-dependent protein kinase [Chloropicon primus]UPQ99721.1 cGMP-dependent protein kinase [Chloropicon primus]|eukprot:QDZ20511.1 cGMP-dependent protein kinase [Chloropicon primus]